MDGMDKHLAYVLASKGIVTMEDLAEQGVDDLLDIEDMTEERAAELIMTARAPWLLRRKRPPLDGFMRHSTSGTERLGRETWHK